MLDGIEYTNQLQVKLVQLLHELLVYEDPSCSAKAQRLMDLIPQVMFDIDEQEGARWRSPPPCWKPGQQERYGA